MSSESGLCPVPYEAVMKESADCEGKDL